MGVKASFTKRGRGSLCCNHRGICNLLKGHKGPCVGSSGPCSCDDCLGLRVPAHRDPCVYCNGVATTVDHVVPKSRGGTDQQNNRAPACRRCNGDKGNDTLLMYLALRRHWNLGSLPYRRKPRNVSLAAQARNAE